MRPLAHTRWGAVCLLPLIPAANCFSSSPGVQAKAPSPACAEAARSQVDVDLGKRSYPIHIGADLLRDPQLLQRHVSGKRVLIVTNDTIAPLYLDRCKPAPDTRQHATCTHNSAGSRESGKTELARAARHSRAGHAAPLSARPATHGQLHDARVC